MNPLFDNHLHLTRREFFGRGACGIGTAALASLLGHEGLAAENKRVGGLPVSAVFVSP